MEEYRIFLRVFVVSIKVFKGRLLDKLNQNITRKKSRQRSNNNDRFVTSASPTSCQQKPCGCS